MTQVLPTNVPYQQLGQLFDLAAPALGLPPGVGNISGQILSAAAGQRPITQTVSMPPRPVTPPPRQQGQPTGWGQSAPSTDSGSKIGILVGAAIVGLMLFKGK